MLLALLPVALAAPADWAHDHLGATLRAGPAATLATRTRLMGDPVTGLGPRATAGLSVALGPSLAVGLEAGLQEVNAGEVVPAEDGAIAPFQRELHLWQQGLYATWRPGALSVTAGLSYARASGRLRLGDLTDCETEDCAATPGAEPADQPVSVNLRAGGPALAVAWAAWEREAVRVGPALEAGAWSDLDRWYPWAALTVGVGFGR